MGKIVSLAETRSGCADYSGGKEIGEMTFQGRR